MNLLNDFVSYLKKEMDNNITYLAVMKANDICNYFRCLEKDIVDNIDEYRKLIIANAKKYNIKLGKNVSKLDFTIIIEDNYVVLYETKYLMKIRLFDFTKYMN